MVWYVGITKGVTKGRTPNVEVFKSCRPPSIFSHGRKYHEVRGPFTTFVVAREASHTFHVDSGNVGGRHKSVTVREGVKP